MAERVAKRSDIKYPPLTASRILKRYTLTFIMLLLRPRWFRPVVRSKAQNPLVWIMAQQGGRWAGNVLRPPTVSPADRLPLANIGQVWDRHSSIDDVAAPAHAPFG